MSDKHTELYRFVRYNAPEDFSKWNVMALRSLVPPSEGFVLGIDCIDGWLFTQWGTKLALTEDRVVAFKADPSNPIKRSYCLNDITGVKYDTGTLTAEIRLLGPGFYDVYSVPKRLGYEFSETLRARLDEGSNLVGENEERTR